VSGVGVRAKDTALRCSAAPILSPPLSVLQTWIKWIWPISFWFLRRDWVAKQINLVAFAAERTISTTQLLNMGCAAPLEVPAISPGEKELLETKRALIGPHIVVSLKLSEFLSFANSVQVRCLFGFSGALPAFCSLAFPPRYRFSGLRPRSTSQGHDKEKKDKEESILPLTVVLPVWNPDTLQCSRAAVNRLLGRTARAYGSAAVLLEQLISKLGWAESVPAPPPSQSGAADRELGTKRGLNTPYPGMSQLYKSILSIIRRQWLRRRSWRWIRGCKPSQPFTRCKSLNRNVSNMPHTTNPYFGLLI
jgi:hypothetical protein